MYSDVKNKMKLKIFKTQGEFMTEIIFISFDSFLSFSSYKYMKKSAYDQPNEKKIRITINLKSEVHSLLTSVNF